ncbi:HNH/endonuclease VII fold putative polymorphic toxin, partial [Streptococcus acidominimus]
NKLLDTPLSLSPRLATAGGSAMNMGRTTLREAGQNVKKGFDNFVQAFAKNGDEVAQGTGKGSRKANKPSRSEAFRSAKRDAGIPNSQHPKKVDRAPMTDMNGKQQLDSEFRHINTREYHYENKDGKIIVIQEHSAGHTYGPEGTVGNQGAHFNIRPIDDLRNGKIDGTRSHYPFQP